MSKIPETILLDWLKNKKRIQDRLNRINKRIKKYTKQKNHFESRIRAIEAYEKKIKEITKNI
jgi:chaperonin cofactor prefoldin